MDVIAENGPVSLLFSHITCSIDPKPCFFICVPRFFLCSASGVEVVVFLSVIPGSRRNSMACPILRATMVKMWRSGQPRKRDQCIEVVSEDVSANSLKRSWIHQTSWHQFMIFFAEDSVHGDDVFWPEELYYYLDATPTHSYMKMMYKYPQALMDSPAVRLRPSMAQHGPAPKAEFPYDELRRVNFERKKDPLLLNLACITPSESQQVTLTATLTVTLIILDTILDPCESQGVWVAGHRDFRWQSILWCRDRAPALAWTRRERTRAEHGGKMGTFPTISAGMPRQIRMILSQLP